MTVRSLCKICGCCHIYIKIHVCIKVEMDDKYAFRMGLNGKHFECLVHHVYIHIKATELNLYHVCQQHST